MTAYEPTRTVTPLRVEPVFSRILIGVDGTEPGFEACRQAVALAEPDAVIEAISVAHLADAFETGYNAPRVMDELEREAEAALGAAARILGARGTTRFVNGFVGDSLLREAGRTDATLIALGTHGHRRATEILIGGVLGEVLHRARCSVLVARPSARAAAPRIVVGSDGSPAALAAVEVAEELARRLAAPLRIVTAPDHPVPRLVAAAADLLVVGSRGLRGVKALGSVSERVAHEAACSVLVVRGHR